MLEHPILTFFHAEAESGSATNRSLAFGYAVLITLGDQISRADWVAVNEAVETALDLRCTREVDAFRRLAGEIAYAAAYRAEGTRGLIPVNEHIAPGAVP